MSSDWPTKTLDDVCEKITDGAHASPKSVINGKPMASVKDLTPFGVDLSFARQIDIEDFNKLIKQGCRPEVGDVLIAKDGNSALDTVCTVRKPLDAVLLSSVAILRPDTEQLDSDFLKYYFSSKSIIEYLKSNFISGAAIPRVVLRDFRKAEIKLPPLDVQKRIATVLNSLNDKIELNHQINQTLEAMAQAIFKSWFVDFEPVKAKIAAIEAGEDAESVNRAAMRAISGRLDDELDKMQAEQPEEYAQLKGTAELFPAAMWDSELGEVPEGWGVKEVPYFGQVVCGKTPPKKNSSYYGNDVPFLKIPDMHGKVFATNTADNLSAEGDCSQPKKRINKGSVCVSCIATVGLVNIASTTCHTNQQINSIIPKKEAYTEYLYLYFLGLNKTLHDLASGGSATLNLNTGHFSKIKIMCPNEAVIDKFSKSVSNMFSRILNNDLQSYTLSNLRDTLLPKLLSSELSVENIKLDEADA